MTKKHYFWIAVAAGAVLTGCLYVGPQLLIKGAVEASDRTFVLSHFNILADGGDAYFQFAREIYDGHFPPSDLYFQPQLPNIYPPLPPLILSAFLFLTGGNVISAYLAALLVLPALLFLIFVWLGGLIFDKDRLWALFFGFGGVLTPVLLVFSHTFFNPERFITIVFKNFYPGVATVLPLLFWTRIDYPLLTSLIYFPAIAMVFIFWKNPKPSTAITAGVVSGLLFYTYFHIWAYWVTVGGLLFWATVWLYRKDRKLIKNFFILTSALAVTSLPYFLSQISLNRLPGYKDYITRLGIEVGRHFNWEAWRHYLVYLILALVIYWVFWRNLEKRKWAVFYWAALAAGLIVWNVQLVLGFVPHPDHWPRAIDPLIVIMILDLVYFGIKKAEGRYLWVRKAVPMFLIALIALLLVKKVVNLVKFIIPPPALLANYVLPEPFHDSWRWIDQNLKEPKIASSSFVSNTYAMAFTGDRPVLTMGGLAPITNFEIEQRFLIINKAFSVSEAVLEKRLRGGRDLNCDFDCGRLYMDANLHDARFFLYQLYYENEPGVNRNKIPESKITELLNRYRDIKGDWRATGADYVYWGPLERQFSRPNLSQDSSLELVYQNSLVSIYRIRK